jgi:hypothetical protein
MSQPTGAEPVNVSSLQRSSVTNRSAAGTRRWKHRQRTTWPARCLDDLGQDQRHRGSLRRRLTHNRTARRNRRCHLVNQQVERKVKRADCRNRDPAGTVAGCRSGHSRAVPDPSAVPGPHRRLSAPPQRPAQNTGRPESPRPARPQSASPAASQIACARRSFAESRPLAIAVQMAARLSVVSARVRASADSAARSASSISAWLHSHTSPRTRWSYGARSCRRFSVSTKRPATKGRSRGTLEDADDMGRGCRNSTEESRSQKRKKPKANLGLLSKVNTKASLTETAWPKAGS